MYFLCNYFHLILAVIVLSVCSFFLSKNFGRVVLCTGLILTALGFAWMWALAYGPTAYFLASLIPVHPYAKLVILGGIFVVLSVLGGSCLLGFFTRYVYEEFFRWKAVNKGHRFILMITTVVWSGFIAWKMKGGVFLNFVDCPPHTKDYCGWTIKYFLTIVLPCWSAIFLLIFSFVVVVFAVIRKVRSLQR